MQAKAFLLALCVCLPATVSAEETEVVYINGVLSSLADASLGRFTSHEIFLEAGELAPGEVVTSSFRYNPSLRARSDLSEALVQRVGELIGFSDVLNALDGLPQTFIDPLDVAELIAGIEFQSADYSDSFRGLVDAGKRVIIFAHSQGNFLANSSFEALPGAYVPYVGILGVASPAAYVADGRNQFVNDCGDLLIGLVGTLECTATNAISDSQFDLYRHRYLPYYARVGSDTYDKLLVAAGVLATEVLFPSDEVIEEPPLPPLWRILIDLDYGSCNAPNAEAEDGVLGDTCDFALYYGEITRSSPISLSLALSENQRRNLRRDWVGDADIRDDGMSSICDADTESFSNERFEVGDVFDFEPGHSLLERTDATDSRPFIPATIEFEVQNVSDDNQFMSGVLNVTFPYEVFDEENEPGPIATGTATGTWTAFPLEEPFPKCEYRDPVPGIDIIGCTGSGVEFTNPNDVDVSCDYLGPDSPARPGEWAGS